MSISVVIPTLNSAETIKECILSFQNQTYKPNEVIIIDGGSSDGTCEICDELNVKLIKDENDNPGMARNSGVKESSEDIIFLSDSDCLADERVLEYHLNCYKKYEISGVMGSIRNADPGNLVSDYVQREIMESQWRNSLGKDGFVKYFHTGTYNLSFYRNILIENKFAEDQPASSDTELSLRLREKLKILFEPRAIVFHHHPKSLLELFRQRKWYGEGFYHLTNKICRDEFKAGTFFQTALRFIDYPEDYLKKAVTEDNRLLCEGCSISRCIIDFPRISISSLEDIDISRVICLGFASGVLNKRTGIDFDLSD
jgi:glycosyltransferase involved in cell wall biosynthesis